jgi:uncharacterized protein (TIGR02466 family)
MDHKHLIFQTPIWGYVLNSEIFAVHDYIEYIHNLAQSEQSVKKSNSGGWQSRDTLQNDAIFREFVNNTMKNLYNNILKEYTDIPHQITSMWANINRNGDFNYHHTHEGTLSGVFYLQVPKNSGRLIFTNPAIRSEQHIIKNSSYPVDPQPLACIVFPSWLEHYVEPNHSTEDRISISFNIGPL